MVANKWLMLGCASMALISSQALAQAPSTSDEVSKTDGPITQASDIVVIAGIGYRDRTDTPEPVLKYGTDYFQRFEPLTAGDALKRVPSVTFLSDVIESDAPQLRGLPPEELTERLPALWAQLDRLSLIVCIKLINAWQQVRYSAIDLITKLKTPTPTGATRMGLLEWPRL